MTSGSVVTATKGGKSVTGTAVDGVCVLVVPEAGVWTVSATLGGKTTPAQTVTVKSQWEAALEYGTPLGELAVGSSVFTNVGGVRTEFLVVQQGKPSDIYDDSCDGTWLLMKDCYSDSHMWGTSEEDNTLESSYLQNYLNSTVLGAFDSGFQSLVSQVKIPYRQGGGNGSSKSGADGLTTKVFFLSLSEIGVTNVTSMPEAGAKLDYFESGATTSANRKRIAYMDGTAKTWWTRSPQANNFYYVWFVKANGDRNTSRPTESKGVRPAIILPSDTFADLDSNIVIPA